MNKALYLFDEQFMRDYLRRKLLPLYPSFSEIVKLEIKPYKKMVWETTYHVVVSYQVYLSGPGQEPMRIPLVCSAHSDEPRENSYLALKYLWEKKFINEKIDLPKPLFFSYGFNGVFYQALEGENLLYYINAKQENVVKEMIQDAARLFARLHNFPVGPEANFNPLNARIATVIPGTKFIFQEISKRYQNKYVDDIKKIYEYFIAEENKFFLGDFGLKLIHGDFHPENILKTAPDKIGLIDFTDLCLGDFARDLGTFLQQLDYKFITKTGDHKAADEMKKLFLDSYFEASGFKRDAELEKRINLYYQWTAMRTTVYWFLKFGHNEERGANLLKTIKNSLPI